MPLFLLTFVAGIGILISLAGWGFLLARLLRLQQKMYLGSCAAIGLAVSTNVGGFLDYFHAIMPLTVRIFLGIGAFVSCAIFVRGILGRRGHLGGLVKPVKYSRTVVTLGVIIACVATFRYTTSLSPGNFHLQDDYSAYFVFPVKMLETGSLGQDPFSERRLISSLGGNPFLDTFPLSVTNDVRTLGLIDQGTTYLILLLLVAEIMSRRGISAYWIALVLTAVASFPAPISNITAMYGGIVLLLFSMELLDRAVDDTALNLRILLAIVLASLASLKTTFAPVAAILFLSFFGLQLVRVPDRRKTLIQATGCVALIVFLLLPWMIDSYRSSGTLFYPVFGKGYHGSRYGTYLLPTASMGLHNIFAFLNGVVNPVGVCLACLASLAVITGRQTRSEKLFRVVIVFNLIVDVIVIGIGTGGVQMYRYSFAVLFAFLVFLLIDQLVIFSSTRGSVVALQTPATIGLVITYGLLLGAGWSGFTQEMKDRLKALDFALKGEEIVTPAEVTEYREMQSTIPPGQTVMARLDKNFLLDFRRNPVYINDLPGGASLPPGLPILQGPDALSNYLLEHKIRYLAYSYGDEATFSRAEFKDRLELGVNVWLRRGAEIAFDFQDNAAMLGRTRKRLFDDGKMFVVDLASPGSAPDRGNKNEVNPSHALTGVYPNPPKGRGAGSMQKE